MAINPRDDYEALAKLLYPSIEASGNVYYGQTRKLTMDEILGKNELDFESHIESIKVDDNSADYGFTYDSYFCWRLGSLKGSVKVILGVNDKTADTFPDASKIILREVSGDTIIKDSTENNTHAMIGTAYACYIINSESKKLETNIHSGVYSTYEKEVSAQFDCICVIDSNRNPINVREQSEDIENRNFFFNLEDRRLYVKVCSGNINNHIADDSESNSNNELELWGSNLFRIMAIDGDVEVGYSVHGTSDEFNNNFRMEYTSGPNVPFTILQPNEHVTIKSGKAVAFRLQSDIDFMSVSARLPIISNGELQFSSQWPTANPDDIPPDSSMLDNDLAYAQFHMSKSDSSSNAHVKLIGILGEAFASPNYQSCAVYANLFKDCELITELDDSFMFDYYWSINSDESYYRYYQTFSGCTGLTKAIIHAEQLYNHMFVKTYKDCSSIREVRFSIGDFSYYDVSQSLDDYTFEGCDQIECIYTIGNFGNEFIHRPSYLEFDLDQYNIARSMVPSHWHVDNGWLLFVRSEESSVTININIADSVTWDSPTQNKNELFQYIYSDSNDFDSGWMYLNTDTGVELSGSSDRGVFIRLREDVGLRPRDYGDTIGFTMESDDVSCAVRAYGSIRSLRGSWCEVENARNYEFMGLFKDCALLEKAPNIDEFSYSNAAYDEEALVMAGTEFGQYAFANMFEGCTRLTEFPKISVWGLPKNAFEAAFFGCTSLSSITKMSDWFNVKLADTPESPAILGTWVFSNTFAGCTSLEAVPEILFGGSIIYEGDEYSIFANNIIPAYTYYNTFYCCSNLRTFTTSGVSDSHFDNNQFLVSMYAVGDAYRKCIFFTDQDNIDWKGLYYIPEKWYLAGDNEFNCKLLSPDGEFKSGLIIASGADSKKNGRGLVTDRSTESNMLQYSPILSTKMDSYDLTNGQFNQDIWGIKCFNSPVIFRNGIYGENVSFIATDIDSVDCYHFSNSEQYTFNYDYTETDISGSASTLYFKNNIAVLKMQDASANGVFELKAPSSNGYNYNISPDNPSHGSGFDHTIVDVNGSNKSITLSVDNSASIEIASTQQDEISVEDVTAVYDDANVYLSGELNKDTVATSKVTIKAGDSEITVGSNGKIEIKDADIYSSNNFTLESSSMTFVSNNVTFVSNSVKLHDKEWLRYNNSYDVNFYGVFSYISGGDYRDYYGGADWTFDLALEVGATSMFAIKCNSGDKVYPGDHFYVKRSSHGVFSDYDSLTFSKHGHNNSTCTITDLRLACISDGVYTASFDSLSPRIFTGDDTYSLRALSFSSCSNNNILYILLMRVH